METAGGLDPKALAVYRAMLRFPDLSDDDLAEKAEVDRSEFEAALVHLRQSGFLAFDESGTNAPVSPESALSLFAGSEWSRAKAVVDGVTALRESLPRMTEDYEAGLHRSKRLLEFEVVLGVELAGMKLMELVGQTKRDYVFLRNDQPSNDRPLTGSDDEDEPVAMLAKRGGSVRIILPSKFRDSQYGPKLASNTQHGQLIRLSPDLMPPMFAVFDDAVALIALDPDDTRKGAIVVRSRAMVLALRRLFDEYWRTCTPAISNSSGAGRKAEILRMLSSGAKDEAIGRALGVGLRTIRREIADLMDEYDAGSRFQLGMLIERRGSKE